MKTPFRLVRSKRKSVTLVIEADGTLLVRAPLRLALHRIEALVAEKSAWIAQKQALVLASRPAGQQYASGEPFWFLGRTYPLCVTGAAGPGAGGRLYFSGEKFILESVPSGQAAELFRRWYQEQARVVIGGRTAELAARWGFVYQGLRITSARTRWGSCSRSPAKNGRATLSFAWRLVMAPPELVDYVIIHELCHLAHPNHSPAFWAAVGAIDPAYPAHRTWLRANGALLTL